MYIESASSTMAAESSNTAYQVFAQYSTELSMHLKSSNISLAGKLWGKSIIKDDLHTNIIQRTLSVSASERTHALLLYIYDKLCTPQSHEASKAMENFKAILRSRGPACKDLLDLIGNKLICTEVHVD